MMSTRYFKGIFDLQYFQLMIGLLEHNPIISKGRPKLKTFFFLLLPVTLLYMSPFT